MRLPSFAGAACAVVLLVFCAVAMFHVVQGCSASQSCCDACRQSDPAVFDLTCSTSGVEVVATGPCAVPDAGLAPTLGTDAIFVSSTDAGACHIELTFVSGFTYSADVTFASKSGGVCGGPQCKCPDYLVPTSGPFQVQNPSATCIEAGAMDAGDAGARE